MWFKYLKKILCMIGKKLLNLVTIPSVNFKVRDQKLQIMECILVVLIEIQSELFVNMLNSIFQYTNY